MRSIVACLAWAGCAGSSAEGLEADPCRGEAAPDSLDAFVDHVGALPSPVTIPCVLRSLARPLRVVGSTETFSAQPAEGPESPRIFVLLDGLTLSVVPTGEGSPLIELGEPVDARRTRKAELAFPLRTPIAPGSWLDRVEDAEGGTTCAVCHTEEVPHPDGGWTSVALRPRAVHRVTVADLRRASLPCWRQDAPARCGLLEALLDGEVEDGAFPSTYPTIDDLSDGR